MGSIKKLVFLVLIACNLSFCVSKQHNQMDFPQEIADAYFQEWIGGQVPSGKGVNFYIKFKKPLPKDIVLQSIYFQNQKTVLETEDNQSFVAHFYQLATKHDLILDSDPLKEYGNKAPVITKPKFDLKRNEAVIEYKKANKIFYYKMLSVKEKPIIAYPSKNKPKN